MDVSGIGKKGTFWDQSICTNNRIEGYYYVQKDITSVTISEGIEIIDGYVFCASQGLTKITIPSSVTSIGYSAFYNCTSLTEITIPSSVTTMGGVVFGGIPSITVHVPWKEGEKPEGWADAWNYPDSPDYTITVDYAK